MYHTYSSVTGRLIRTTYQKAYVPQGFKTLVDSHPVNPYPPTYQVASAPVLLGKKQESVVSQTRSGSSGPARLAPGGVPYGPLSDRIRRLQEKFQKDDGIPVHLKGGPLDRVLYYLTLGLCVVGVAKVLHVVFLYSVPQKPASSD